LFLLPAGQAFAATFNVANNNQLSAAWSAINSNGEADIINITASFNVSTDLEFYDSAPSTLTINGNGHTLTLSNSYEPFTPYSDRTLYLNNITLTDNVTVAAGGARGIYVEGTAIIDRLTTLSLREGIRVALGGKVIVSNSLFRDNVAGGIRVQGASLEVRNSRFINNTASHGSAIYANTIWNPNIQPSLRHADIKLYNNTFTGNTAKYAGGGCHDAGGGVCEPYTRSDFFDAQGAFVLTGGLRNVENEVWKRIDIPGGFLDMRGNTITGNNFDCFVSDFVTINPASFNSNNIIGPNSNPTCLTLHGARPAPSKKGAASEGDSGAIYIPPTATPSATATPGLSTCLTLPGIVTYNITESTQCQRLNAEGIGNAEIAASGFADAVNVWSWVLPGTKICFEAEGSAFKFIDTAPIPRVVYDVPATNENGLTCATIDRAGNLILLPGARPPAAQMQPTALQETTLSGCMARTTHILNFRASPGGDVIRAVPYNATLTAVARTADWFKVDFHGVKGWISAAFVEQIGTCG